MTYSAMAFASLSESVSLSKRPIPSPGFLIRLMKSLSCPDLVILMVPLMQGALRVDNVAAVRMTGRAMRFENRLTGFPSKALTAGASGHDETPYKGKQKSGAYFSSPALPFVIALPNPSVMRADQRLLLESAWHFPTRMTCSTVHPVADRSIITR